MGEECSRPDELIAHIILVGKVRGGQPVTK
jgi:hypothetical protein